MDRFNLRIIKAVKNCPNLYKNSVSMEVRKEEWQKLALRHGLNEVQIRRRWHALRESFIYSHIVRNSNVFPYKNEMDFLLPYVQSRILGTHKKQPPGLEFNITQEDLELMDDYEECEFQEIDDIALSKLRDFKPSGCQQLINPGENIQKMAKELQEQKKPKPKTQILEPTKDQPRIAVRTTGQLMPKRIASKRTVNMTKVPENLDPVASNKEVKPTPIKKNTCRIIPVKANNSLTSNTEKNECNNTVEVAIKGNESNIPAKRGKVLVPHNANNSLTSNTEKNECNNTVEVAIKGNESNIPAKRGKVLVPITKPNKCANVKPKKAAKVVLEKAKPLPKTTNRVVTRRGKKLANMNTEDGVLTETAIAVVDNKQKATPIPGPSEIVPTTVTEEKEEASKKCVIINKRCYTSTRSSLAHLQISAQKRNQYRMFGNFVGDLIGQMPKEKRIETMSKMITLLYS